MDAFVTLAQVADAQQDQSLGLGIRCILDPVLAGYV
jgi:hypothetical protein